MKMSNAIKVGDQFKLPVRIGNRGAIVQNDGEIIDYSKLDLMVSCIAINNHDRMVEEIAELRKGLEIMIEQFESDHNCEYEYNIIRWNKDLLAKLNQEGEE